MEHGEVQLKQDIIDDLTDLLVMVVGAEMFVQPANLPRAYEWYMTSLSGIESRIEGAGFRRRDVSDLSRIVSDLDDVINQCRVNFFRRFPDGPPVADHPAGPEIFAFVDLDDNDEIDLEEEDEDQFNLNEEDFFGFGDDGEFNDEIEDVD